MKKILLPILALGGLLFASSCQMQEPDSGTITGEVDFSITAGIPGSINTYASNDGGATNVPDGTYDQRFILEVYDGDAVAYRAVTTVEIGNTASFDVRLLAKKYTFALWADFVTNESTTDNLYNTSEGLDAVTIKTDRSAGQEIADAYCYSEEVDLTEGSLSKTFTLRRPFGKIRLVSTDAAENYTAPGSVTVTYGPDILVPTGYNVLTGEAYGENAAAGSYTFTPYSETVTVGGEDKGTLYILGIDYIIASKSATSVSFDVKVDDNGARSVTNIPVSANKLTTVIGNFYTNEGNIDVIVEDEFSEDEEQTFNAPITVTSQADLIEILNSIPENNDVEQIIIIPEDLVIGGEAFSLIINKSNVTIKGANAGDSQTGSAGQTFATSTAENISGYIEGTIQIAADNVTLDGLNFSGKTTIINQNYEPINNFALKNCHAENINGVPGFLYLSGNDSRSDGITITNNTVINVHNDSNNASAFLIWKCDNVAVSGNTIEDTDYHGIQLNSNNNISISGNTVTNAPYCGIQIADYAEGNVSITGNEIYNCNTIINTNASLNYYGGIRVYSSKDGIGDIDLNITGNVISNSEGDKGDKGIYVYNRTLVNDVYEDKTPAQWSDKIKDNVIKNYNIDIQTGTSVLINIETGESLSEIITMMDEPVKLKVTGAITSSDLSKIKNKFISVPSSATKHVLKELDLSETTGLTQIGANAFNAGSGAGGNKVLERILLPNSVKKIGMMAFFWNRALKEISVMSQLESIGVNAFDGCGFEEITLGPSLKEMGDKAFSGCDMLKSVTFNSPELKVLPTDAFNGCSNLTNVTLPENIESIGERAFMSCSKLTTIAFPASLKEVYSTAFPNRILEDVTSYATTPPTVLAFEMPGKHNAILRVPSESVEFYKADVNWSTNFNIVPIEE